MTPRHGESAFLVTAGPPDCYGTHPQVEKTATEVRLAVGRLPAAADRQCQTIAVESAVPVTLSTPLADRKVVAVS